MLYEAGVDVKTAQEWAGHATVGTLMDIYTHLSNEQKSAAANKLKVFVSEENFYDNFTTKRSIENWKKAQRIAMQRCCEH